MTGPRCVIIGSGLGGLACGVLAARSGYDVTVLEQDAAPGGCLRSFRRGGAVFDTGLHYVGSAAPGQPLHSLLSLLGVADGLRLSRLDPAAYDVVSLGGERYAFANGREAFIDTLAARFPDGRAALERYRDMVADVAAASSLRALADVDATAAARLAPYQQTSLHAVLADLTADVRLARVLAGRLPLIAATRRRTPFALHAFITDFYDRSAFRLAGGSQSLAEALAARLAEAGGRLLTRTRAVSVTTNAAGVTGVTVADGNHYPADVVISDAPPVVTLGLVDGPQLRPAFRRRIAALPQTTGCFTLYLRFRPGAMPYAASNFFCYAGPSPWDCEDYTAADWPRGYLYMHGCAAEDQRYAQTAEVISYMNAADVAPWADTRTGRRGAAYEDFKARRAECLLAAVERDFPGTTAAVEAVYTSTPLTYRDYTGTPGGAMYGVAADCTTGAAGRVPVQWRLPGLLQTGQCVNSHGILGTLVGALQTCSRLPLVADGLTQWLRSL